MKQPTYIILEVDSDDTGTIDSILDGGSVQSALEEAFSDLAGECAITRSNCTPRSPFEDARRMREIEALLEAEYECTQKPCSNARHALVCKLRAILVSEERAQ